MAQKPNPAAELARKRWENTSEEERSEVGTALNVQRNKKLSAKRRSEIARAAAAARWKKKP
jgi:hypothetical protein